MSLLIRWLSHFGVNCPSRHFLAKDRRTKLSPPRQPIETMRLCFFSRNHHRRRGEEVVSDALNFSSQDDDDTRKGVCESKTVPFVAGWNIYEASGRQKRVQLPPTNHLNKWNNNINLLIRPLIYLYWNGRGAIVPVPPDQLISSSSLGGLGPPGQILLLHTREWAKIHISIPIAAAHGARQTSLQTMHH